MNPNINCYACGTLFYKKPNHIQRCKFNFCSRKCYTIHRDKKIDLVCPMCNSSFRKEQSRITGKDYCSSSCAAKYNNAHKTKGTRRSKLELWIETQLAKLYPNLTIEFNKKTAINSELDIYIPSLNLAFELNGIFHYEPIFGNNRLGQVKSNDFNKFQKCQELGISLCIIDTSKQKYFKEQTSRNFLDIITSIISQNYSVTKSTT